MEEIDDFQKRYVLMFDLMKFICTSIISQPFSKSDRIGKISDWTGTVPTDKKYSSEFDTIDFRMKREMDQKYVCFCLAIRKKMYL